MSPSDSRADSAYIYKHIYIYIWDDYVASCSAHFVTGVRFTYICYGINHLEFLFENTFADQQITEVRRLLAVVAAGLPCNCF